MWAGKVWVLHQIVNGIPSSSYSTVKPGKIKKGQSLNCADGWGGNFNFFQIVYGFYLKRRAKQEVFLFHIQALVASRNAIKSIGRFVVA